jgi:nucleoid-associated protein YgaU
VQRGDTYAALAQKYYGNQRYAQFLVESNPDHADPLRLRVGDVLRIPPASELPARLVAERSTARQPKLARGQRVYTVREGDTFFGLAARELGNGSRWPELYELNKDVVGEKPDGLRPGQTLILPPKSPGTGAGDPQPAAG